MEDVQGLSQKGLSVLLIILLKAQKHQSLKIKGTFDKGDW